MTQAIVATYLIERLKQAGLRQAFGLPGDYVLTFMDDEALELLLAASRPVILGGVELHRYGLMAEFRRLVEASGVPVATTLLGKTVISEHHPQAIGVYEGDISRREVRDIVRTPMDFCASAPG